MHTLIHTFTVIHIHMYTHRSYYIPITERKIREKILKAEKKNTYSRTKKIFTIFLIETIGIKSVQSKKICQSRIVLFDKNIFRKE